MKKGGPALAALLLLPLVPLGGAANPEPAPWSPYDALSDVRAIAIAAEGTTFAAALGPAIGGETPAPPTVGVPTVSPPATDVRTQRGDLSILDTEYGFARNGTRSTPSSAAQTTALGKTHVAVSRAGFAIAALGNETAASGERLKLHYSRITPGGNWSSASLTDVKIDLGGNPVDLALSDDGARVVALTQDGPQYRLVGFTATGTTLASSFDFRGDGAPFSLAATGDLSRMVVSVKASTENANPQVHSFAFTQSAPTSTFTQPAGGNIRAVGVSREGGTAVASGPRGTLLLFPGGAGDLSAPINATVGAEDVTQIVVSEDGSRIAALAGRTLGELSWDGATLRQLWNATLPGTGNVSITMNKTGAIVLVGIGGNGMYAYSEKDGTPGWSFANAAMRVAAVNGAGTEVVYALGSRIVAATLPRAIALEFPGGAKTAPAKPVMREVGATFAIAIRNPGAAPETVVLSPPGATDLAFRAEPASVLVKPNEIVTVNVTISSDIPLTSPRSFDVVARSLGAEIRDNLTLLLTPEFRTNVSLQLSATEVVARAGEPASIIVGVFNNGTTDTSVTLRVSQQVSAGREWALALNEGTGNVVSFTALRSARTSVRITATPPADAANGTASTLGLSLEGANVSDFARVVFRINPNLGVAVNATGVTRFIEPGQRGLYNVTVTNNGSLPREYEAFYQVVSADAKPWAVDVPGVPFRLDPNAKRTIQVAIVAPASAVPGTDRVSVLIFARSIPEGVNETAVSGNVTLYGIAVAPPPTPTPTDQNNPIPFPGVASLALALALALGRRRSR